jgi:hypothetical protein
MRKGVRGNKVQNSKKLAWAFTSKLSQDRESLRRILDTPDFRMAGIFHGNDNLPPVDEHKPHLPF